MAANDKKTEEDKKAAEEAALANAKFPVPADIKTAREAKDGTERTFELLGGPHRDAEGDHEAGTETRFVKSKKDLVAIHGSEKFREVDNQGRQVPTSATPTAPFHKPE